MGDDIGDQLRRLSGQSRGGNRAGEAPTRDAIPESVSEAVPEAVSSTGGGTAWPIEEQAYAGATFYMMVSSDGLTAFEYGDVTTYLDNNGDQAPVINLDPSA
ncbi:MAG: hypothetical protein KDJ39_05830 [Gammaproteobacteria bacterium]|nr:hypothetical protein [Gammaproteobacteria bacterium]